MKRMSVTKRLTLSFAILLVISLSVAAGLNYYKTNNATLRRDMALAESCAYIVGHTLDECGLDTLSSGADPELYSFVRRSLRILCKSFAMDYLYVYYIDPETALRTFVFCVASDDEQDLLVQKERFLWAVSDDEPDDAEKAILAGATDLRSYALSNQYGDEMTWLMPYRGQTQEPSGGRFVLRASDEDPPLAIIGMDNSIAIERENIFRNFMMDVLPIFLVLLLVFLIQLIVAQKRFLQPIRSISESMNSFALDSSRRPEPLNITFRDEIGDIAASYEKMTEAISSYVANIETLTREKVETNVQLDVARHIQYGLVPETMNLNGDGFSVSALTHPARSVGGDFYDCFMRDEKTVCIVMGDVSGKGISAAIFMAMVKTMIREKLLACLSPAEALNEANDELCAQNPENLFATVFAGLLNIDTGRLHYANAGHTYPVLLKNAPSLLVPDPGIALGLFEGSGIVDASIELAPSEGILLYTDGITEAVNPQKKFFGEERLLEVLKKGPWTASAAEGASKEPVNAEEGSAEAAVSSVSKAVEAFIDGGDPFDDAAVLALFRTGGCKPVAHPVPVALSSFDKIKEAVFEAAGESQETRQALLACDEALTNIVSYSGASSLSFSCIKEGDSLCVSFSDDGIPFDPTAAQPGDKDFDMLDSGGMGLSLIRQIASSLAYKREDGRNQFTLWFSL